MIDQSTPKLSAAAVGSIVRVDHQAGRWEAIPRALIEDDRLSAEARWFAIWLCTKPPGWEIRAGCLPRLLKDRSRRSGHLGRDLVRRLLREPEDAGYLVRTRMRDTDGRWAWRSCLNPTRQVASTIDGSAGDGPAVDGDTVDGKGGDLLQTELIQKKTYSKRTTTTAQPRDSNPSAQDVGVVSVNPLQFPEMLAGDAQRLANNLMQQCPAELRQAVLDQVSVYQQQGTLRKPLGLLYRLVQRAKVGEFIASMPGVRQRKVCPEECKSGPRAMDLRSTGLRLASEIAAAHIAVLRKKWKKKSVDDER